MSPADVSRRTLIFFLKARLMHSCRRVVKAVNIFGDSNTTGEKLAKFARFFFYTV
jgi:hypothetical protein